eukprot:6675115-Prymnesium_polylepis.1
MLPECTLGTRTRGHGPARYGVSTVSWTTGRGAIGCRGCRAARPVRLAPPRQPGGRRPPEVARAAACLRRSEGHEAQPRGVLCTCCAARDCAASSAHMLGGIRA